MVVLGVLSLAGLAIAIPAAVRTGYDVTDAAREADARAEAARRRELIEDQRPRSVPVGAAVVNDVRRLGGLTNPAAAAIVGARMEDGITADVQSRIRAGLLEVLHATRSADRFGPTGARGELQLLHPLGPAGFRRGVAARAG